LFLSSQAEPEAHPVSNKMGTESLPGGKFAEEFRSPPIPSSEKVKESRKRPGVAQRVPGGLGSQIFMTFGT
jgi:hypothetical protein